MRLYYLFFWPSLFLAIDGLPKKFLPRIAGGESKSIELQPYVASLYYGERFNAPCTASIISKNLILTAGHCIADAEISNLIVRAGSRHQKYNGTLHHVESFARHELYYLDASRKESRTTINDIAIAKVEPPFTLDDTCQPIPMFEAGETIKPGSSGVVSGWGYVPYLERYRWNVLDEVWVQLRSAVVPVHEKSVCFSEYKRKNYTLHAGQICAGGNGKDPCRGDSGGPLVVDGRLAGLVSFGYGCGLKGYPPTIYTEIAHFRKWIDEKARKLTGDSPRLDVQPKNTNKLEFHHGMNYYDGLPVWQ